VFPVDFTHAASLQDKHGHTLAGSAVTSTSAALEKPKLQVEAKKREGDREKKQQLVPPVLAGPTCDSSDIAYRSLP
jgi:diaminopimelate decarboxylase